MGKQSDWQSETGRAGGLGSAELTTAHDTAVRRKYAHFQRLMTELMWDGLVGRADPIAGVNVLWLYQDQAGNPLRHDLHLPDSELLEGKPVYNHYQKAFYMVEDERLLQDIQQRLAELARVQAEAKALIGFGKQGTSKHLMFPVLKEGITTLRYWRKEGTSSHLRTKEQTLERLRYYLADKQAVTQQKYEWGGEPDEVLRRRYAEIETLQAQIERIRGLEVDEFREHARFEAVNVYLYDDAGNAEQLRLPDVGMVVGGEDTELLDMDKLKGKRRAYRGGKEPEPLAKVDLVRFFVEAEWQAFKKASQALKHG